MESRVVSASGSTDNTSIALPAGAEVSVARLRTGEETDPAPLSFATVRDWSGGWLQVELHNAAAVLERDELTLVTSPEFLYLGVVWKRAGQRIFLRVEHAVDRRKQSVAVDSLHGYQAPPES